MILKQTLFHRLVATILVFVATLSTASAADSGTGWSYDSTTNTLTLSGSEVAWDGIKAYASTTENVVFAEDYNVSSIPDMAFSRFVKLKAVDLPNVVKSIGYQAFYGCTYLSSVSLPKGLAKIGGMAFAGCSSLVSIYLPEGLKTISSNAFNGCTSLASVTLPDGIESIGESAFFGCSSLASISLPASLKSIGNYAFCYCTSLKTVEIASDGTPDNKHVIYLGDGSDKTAIGYSVFPRDQATLIYDPTTTWIGDDDTQNLRYYFNKFEMPTSIHQTETSTSTPQFYDLGGRPVSPTTHKGLAVKRQGNNSSLITIK